MDAGGDGQVDHVWRGGIYKGETDLQVLEVPGVAAGACRVKAYVQVGVGGWEYQRARSEGLERAASELLLSNYVAWAEAYGADTTGTHLAQFLLNVSPDSAPAELRITGIEVGAEGASVGVGATAGGDAVDLSKINGILSVASGDELGSLAPKAVPPSNVRYEKGDAAILVPSSAGPFIRARIGVAAPTE